MEIKKDNELYEAMHEKVMRELLQSIYSDIKKSELIPEDEIENLVENIGFSIGVVIDGSAEMEVSGQKVLPYLAFSESQEKRRNLIVSDTGSYFHEMVYGITDDIDFE